MLLFSFVGLLLRFAACRLSLLLLNDPPRRPRYEPLSLPDHPDDGMMHDPVPERSRRHQTFLRFVNAEVGTPNSPGRGEGM